MEAQDQGVGVGVEEAVDRLWIIVEGLVSVPVYFHHWVHRSSRRDGGLYSASCPECRREEA